MIDSKKNSNNKFFIFFIRHLKFAQVSTLAQILTLRYIFSLLYLFLPLSMTSPIFVADVHAIADVYAGIGSLGNLNSGSLKQALQSPSNGWGPTDRDFLKNLEKNDYLSRAQLNSTKSNSSKTKTLELFLQAAGLHKNSCSEVLPILNRYENYEKYLSFIKKSEYDDKNKSLYFLIDSSLWPNQLILTFKLERINKIGYYDFVFPEMGLFPGLKGKIQAQLINNRCLIYLTANWKGKDIGVPNWVIGVFLETLCKVGLEKLFNLRRENSPPKISLR